MNGRLIGFEGGLLVEMPTDTPIGDALQAAHDARTALAHRRIEAEHELARVEAEMGGGE